MKALVVDFTGFSIRGELINDDNVFSVYHDDKRLISAFTFDEAARLAGHAASASIPDVFLGKIKL